MHYVVWLVVRKQTNRQGPHQLWEEKVHRWWIVSVQHTCLHPVQCSCKYSISWDAHEVYWDHCESLDTPVHLKWGQAGDTGLYYIITSTTLSRKMFVWCFWSKTDLYMDTSVTYLVGVTILVTSLAEHPWCAWVQAKNNEEQRLLH